MRIAALYPSKPVLRTFILASLLISVWFAGSAQERIKFRLKYKPSTVYDEEFVQKSQVTVSLDSASDEVRSAMEAQGFKDNDTKEQDSHMRMALQMGKANAEGVMPLRGTITVDLPDASGATKEIVCYGHSKNGGMPMYDSVHSPGMTTDQKKMMIATMESVASQMSLPDTTMAVGESYRQVAPIHFPLSGVDLKMTITLIYTLLDFTADSAHFAVKETATLDMNASGVPMTGEGAGDGTLTYSRKQECPTNFRTDVTFRFGVKTNGLAMRIKARTVLEVDTKISPVKN